MLLFVKDARYIGDYKIEIEFTDGKKGIADLEGELYGSVFEPLKDKNFFSKIRVDKDLETVVWENGADLAPEFLYYQSFKNDASMQKLFKEWGYNDK